MKNNLLLFLLVTGVLLSPCRATLLVSDSFPVDGSVVGTTPSVGGTWTTLSGTADTLGVTGGKLSLLAGNNEDAASQFSAAQSGNLFAGFDFTITTLPTLSTGGNYLAAFRDGTPASGTYVGQLFTRRISGSPANEFQIGIGNGTTAVDITGAALWSSNLTLNTTYRLILGFDTSADAMALWINPASIASPNISATDSISDVIALDGFAFRQASATHGAAMIDNLVVATTFVEVLAIPEPATCSLVISGPVLAWLARRSRQKIP